MAPLKVYVASATANPETKYRVQRTLMILDGLGIPFDSIDITKPEKAEDRKFMRENAYKDVEDRPKQVLPPQFFYNDEYLGDYDDFDASVEEDTITQFLRLLPDAIGDRIRVNDANKCVAALFTKPNNNEVCAFNIFCLRSLLIAEDLENRLAVISSAKINIASNVDNNVDTETGKNDAEQGEISTSENLKKEEQDEEDEEDEEWEDEDEQEEEEEKEKEEKNDKKEEEPSEKTEEKEEKKEEEDEDLEGEDEEWDEDEGEDEEEEEETN